MGRMKRMMRINDLWKSSEFRMAVNFGAVVFILVPLLGLLNSVPFSAVFRRLLLAEMIFLPLGFGVGTVIRVFSLLEIEPGKTPEAEKKEAGPAAEKTGAATEAPLPAEAGAGGQKESIPPADALKAKTRESGSVIIDNAPAGDAAPSPASVKKEAGPARDAVDIPLEMPHAKPSHLEELARLKQMTRDDSMGKYMIINDRKIINEPEIIAKAVRTMMNRED